MDRTARQLYETALHLPDSERAELAAWLIESLDVEVDDDIEAAWGDEIKRRIEELDQGVVQSVPWPEARRMILGLPNGLET